MFRMLPRRSSASPAPRAAGRLLPAALVASALIAGCIVQPIGASRLPKPAETAASQDEAANPAPAAPESAVRSPLERAAAAERRVVNMSAAAADLRAGEAAERRAVERTATIELPKTRAVSAPRAAAPAPDDPPESGQPHFPATIRVGPDGEAATIAQAARLARDGDTVEVQAGEYRGDVAVWPQKRLTIRAVGGRARLFADGKAAEGKGIWVIPDGEFVIEGFDFEGARVSDRNGAGIRFQRGKLTVRDSRFIGNENGILTGNNRDAELVIEDCVFSGNGHGDGQSHNLYVGSIGRLVVRGSHFRNANVGHLLKSRARFSDVSYNRLTDETSGRASYELEFPAGGKVVAVGNLIEQSAATENSTIVSFGAEGYAWPQNSLAFVHNTVVNRRDAGAVFVRARSGDANVLLANNLFVGKGTIKVNTSLRESGNFSASLRDFIDPDGYDFRPKPGAGFIGQATESDSDVWPMDVLAERRADAQARAGESIGALTTPGAVQPRARIRE